MSKPDPKDVNFKNLQEMIRFLNTVSEENKEKEGFPEEHKTDLKIVGDSKPVMIAGYMKRVEVLDSLGVEMPEAIENYYNFLAGTAEDKDEPICDAVKSAPKSKAAARKKAPPKERDKYGFVVGTKRHLFAKAIEEKPMTWQEIRELEWNNSSTIYPETWGMLRGMGYAYKNKDGKMALRETPVLPGNESPAETATAE